MKTRNSDGTVLIDIKSDQLSWTQAQFRKSLQDVIGEPNVDHPLFIEERDARGFRPLNGKAVGSNTTTYTNWVPTYFGAESHQPASKPKPSNGQFATTLLARTNPSREEVSIPNFIYELKDLPHMIRQMRSILPLLRNLRHRNRAALNSIAGHYLGYEFGWKPLISDISQLLQFQAQVDRRIQELNRLYSGTGLKRRLNLWDDVAVAPVVTPTVHSAEGFAITARITQLTRRRVWGTTRWRPTSPLTDIGRQQLGRTARRLVHGLHHNGIDALQAWNALPFSWLADWFANFGELLAANRNDIPAEHGQCNIMTLTESYIDWFRNKQADDPLLLGADGRIVLRTKERAQASDTLSVHVPLATGRQFSILAALNLQRIKR